MTIYILTMRATRERTRLNDVISIAREIDKSSKEAGFIPTRTGLYGNGDLTPIQKLNHAA